MMATTREVAGARWDVLHDLGARSVDVRSTHITVTAIDKPTALKAWDVLADHGQPRMRHNGSWYVVHVDLGDQL